MRNTTNKNGFTLVELLIVMAIVAILSGLSIFALQGSRESARDAKRKGDLETIKSALELSKSDCGTYPNVSGDADSKLGSPFQRTCNSVTNTYLQVVPKDPSSGSYYYASDGSTFRLCTNLENNPTTAMSCTGCASCDYKVTNP